MASSTIIVGYDGRDHSSDALALAQLIARTTSATLHVVCAYPEDPLGRGGALVDMGTTVRHDAEQTVEVARKVVGEESGIEVEYHALAGAKPSQVLHDFAEERDAAMIVVGSRGLGAIKARVLGSTSRKLLHDTHRPVLVVRTPE